MNKQSSSKCLVILAGGQSMRMGQDKATLEFDGKRLIDSAIKIFSAQVDVTLLSSSGDFGTGLHNIPDSPDMPDGPVGAIFSVARQLNVIVPAADGFFTMPVDAPFPPHDLIERLGAHSGCAAARTKRQLHPTFAYWKCGTVNAVQASYTTGAKAPSLHWLARQCKATGVEWPDESVFANINTPEDLVAATRQYERPAH